MGLLVFLFLSSAVISAPLIVIMGFASKVAERAVIMRWRPAPSTRLGMMIQGALFVSVLCGGLVLALMLMAHLAKAGLLR